MSDLECLVLSLYMRVGGSASELWLHDSRPGPHVCYACPCVLASSRHDDVTPNGSFSRAKKRVYGLYLNSIAHELATDNYKISSQIDALELPLTNIFFGSLKFQSLMP